MQKALGKEFLEAQGRGCYWGKKDFPVNEIKKNGDVVVNSGGTSVDAPTYLCCLWLQTVEYWRQEIL